MKGSKKIKKVTVGRSVAAYGICTLLTVLVVAAIVLFNTYGSVIAGFMGQQTYKVSPGASGEKPEYFTSAFPSAGEMRSYQENVGRRVEEEGMVLLKNDGTLPLPNGAKLSLLGQSSVNFIYGGGGSGSIDASASSTLFQSMENAGFSVNPTLWDFYRKGPGSKYKHTGIGIFEMLTGGGEFSLAEVPRNVYTDTVTNSFKDYNDAAIVVISRSGSEGDDLPVTPLASGRLYLQLCDDERALLDLACENFDRVVVLLNTINAMELGFLEEYDIDACVWVGAVGQTGIDAIGDVLSGAANPSGALVDTYAYDSLSAPSAVNYGDYTIVNSDVESGNKYLVYAEGIYVGYRYYETRYEDVVLGKESAANYNYAKQVQFPFGYGLSYTSFEWSGFTMADRGGSFEFTVNVKNIGGRAGKNIVQIYMQSPYTDYDRANAIEKASAQLVGFAKTGNLAPGASETVRIAVSKEEMKVYDAMGYGTYIVDAGDYYFAIGANVHDALNNMLAAKGKTVADGMDYKGNAALAKLFALGTPDTTTYAVSQATGGKIANLFGDADLRTYDPSFKYLSRSDWSGTWPAVYANGSYTAPQSLLGALVPGYTEDPASAMPAFGTTDASYGKLTAAMLIGLDYDDPRWDALLNQLTQDEMIDLIRMGGYGTMAIPSIGLPGTIDKDGPAGISGTLTGGGISCLSYPVEVVIASTWNIGLAKEVGESVGEDSISSGIAGWYAPATDTHRLPNGGRNFEYYSEDPFLAGKICAGETEGAVKKGVFVFMKHYALNDQERNRVGGSMFANEQSVREIYLRSFEFAVREGGANGAMAGMNRLGPRWAGGHPGLMTGTLRDEWGFVGIVITDQASFASFEYLDRLQGIEAGNNMWLNTDKRLWKIPAEQRTATVMNNVRDSVHAIIYTVVNSNGMNGVAPDSVVKNTTPAWMIIGNVVLAMLALLLVWWAVRISLRLKNRSR